MARYSIVIKRSAARELEAGPLKTRRRLVSRIRGFEHEPRPAGCEKLSGEEKYRIRQGDLRVVYEIDDRGSTVTIVKIGNRLDVYR